MMAVTWPNGTQQELTPDLAKALVAIAKVFPDARAIGLKNQPAPLRQTTSGRSRPQPKPSPATANHQLDLLG